MSIYFISGAPAVGKDYFASKLILDYQKVNDDLEKQGKPRRQIYADTLNFVSPALFPDIKPMPSGDICFGSGDSFSGFVPPARSIFFFNNSERLDFSFLHGLDEHRHSGFDLYFISQSPFYLDSAVRSLVTSHYHLVSLRRSATTSVFVYPYLCLNPKLSLPENSLTINLPK